MWSLVALIPCGSASKIMLSASVLGYSWPIFRGQCATELTTKSMTLFAQEVMPTAQTYQ